MQCIYNIWEQKFKGINILFLWAFKSSLLKSYLEEVSDITIFSIKQYPVFCHNKMVMNGVMISLKIAILNKI